MAQKKRAAVVAPLRNDVVIYARVSSKEQEKEGFSIPAQLKLLRDYAQLKNLVVAKEYTDAETAKQSGRTAFGEMLAFLRANATTCHSVLVEKTDRLYRNLKDWVLVDELGVEIHFVKEGEVLSSSSRSSTKFMHGIKVLMAKNYCDNLSEEVRKGLTEKAEEGLWPVCSPLGYRNVDGANGKKIIEPDPETAPLIVKLFEWYATGNYSLRDATKKAQEAGLVFRAGKGKLPKSTVEKILHNRIYMGEFEWKAKVYQGTHQALISQQLWEQVQAKLSDRRGAPRKARYDFAFSGLISCGHCGCALVGEIKKGRYIYYHCTGYKGRCPEPYTREGVLEERFADVLKGLVLDAEVMGWMTEALRESHVDQRRFHDDAIAHLQAEYAQHQRRIDAMYIDKLDGRIDATFFDAKAGAWREEQRRVLQTIREHQEANQTYLNEGVRILELAQRAHGLFEKQVPREKRRLLNFMLSNCTWRDGQLTPTYRQPFDMLAVSVASHRASVAAGAARDARFENQRGGRDSNPRPPA